LLAVAQSGLECGRNWASAAANASRNFEFVCSAAEVRSGFAREDVHLFTCVHQFAIVPNFGRFTIVSGERKTIFEIGTAGFEFGCLFHATSVAQVADSRLRCA